jgi:hypothetical protein
VNPRTLKQTGRRFVPAAVQSALDGNTQGPRSEIHTHVQWKSTLISFIIIIIIIIHNTGYTIHEPWSNHIATNYHYYVSKCTQNLFSRQSHLMLLWHSIIARQFIPLSSVQFKYNTFSLNTSLIMTILFAETCSCICVVVFRLNALSYLQNTTCSVPSLCFHSLSRPSP